MAGGTAVRRAAAGGTDARTRAHRRRVAVALGSLEHVVRYDEVPAGEAVLVLGRRLSQRPGSGRLGTFEATLRFPGRFGPRQSVELEVVHHEARHASIELRTVGTASRRLHPDRYDRAAGAALWTLEHLLPWQAAVGTSLSLELARELLEQSGAVAPPAAGVLDEALGARVAAADGEEAERVA